MRVASLFSKTISVAIPEELVVRKGTTSVGRDRCRRDQERLNEAVHTELRKAGRRAFRGNVAVHLELVGVSLDRPDEARRTVKAILDSLQGPVYPDDRAVALLDVTMAPGPLQATITICSERQYADAFDVLSGVSSDRDDDDDLWEDIFPKDDPWARNRDSKSDELDLEAAEENLADLVEDRSFYPEALKSKLIGFNRRRIYEYKREELLSTPYLPTDRPGAASLAGRLWNDDAHFPAPARIFLPARSGRGAKSWMAAARDTFVAAFDYWGTLPLLRDEPVAVDLAIGHRASGGCDIDNLAHRVLRAFRESAPNLPSPPCYRAYRRHGDDDSIVVGLHSVRRAESLRRLLCGNPLAASGLRPHPDGPVYRRRPADDEIYEQVQAIGADFDPQGRSARAPSG